MEKTVELKIHKQLIDGTTPAVCWFTIGEDTYCQQADFLLGDLIDIMRRIKPPDDRENRVYNPEPLSRSLASSNYQQSTLALFNYLYDDSMVDWWNAGEGVRVLSKNEKYCADVLELFDALEKRDFAFSRLVFRGFKDFYNIRIPDCSTFYYHMSEGLRGITDVQKFAEDEGYREVHRERLEDYLDTNLTQERHYSFTCHTIRDAVLSLLEYLAEEGYQLAVCRRCGRLYSPVNLASEKYCRRLYGDRECRKLAVNASIKWHLESDQILREYQKKLTSFGSRINGGFSSSEWCKEQKQILMDEYHKRRERMESGEITEEELLNWLKAFETKAPRKNGSKK